MSVKYAACLLALAACGGGGAATSDSGPADASIDAFVPDGHVATDPSVEPGCTTNGCIRSLLLQSQFSIATLRSAVTDPRIQIDNGVDLWSIAFWSDGREVTGLVLVPEIKPPPEGFSTVVMAQPTTGLDDHCTPSHGLLGLGIGAGVASRGLLVLEVDAVGLGTPGPEAWLVRDVTGKSLLDAARAGPHMSQALDVPMTTRTIIVGHSQGGFGAMAAASERASYAPELDLRGFGANAPPAELRRLLDDAALRTDESVSLGPTFFYAWQRWYDLRVPEYVVEPYFDQLDATFTNDCFFEQNGDTGALWTDFPPNGAQVFTPDYLTMATSDAWVEPWASLLAENSPWPADAGAPLRIYQGDADTIVPERLTHQFVDDLRAAGITVDYVVAPGAQHSESAFGPLTDYQVKGDDAIAWVKERLGVH